MSHKFATEHTVRLISSDKKMFSVPLEVVRQSTTINRIVLLEGTKKAIPLPRVTSDILEEIIVYLKHHVNDPESADDVSNEVSGWDKEFLNFDQKTLNELILAADELGIDKLVNLISQSEANIFRGALVERIRIYRDVVNNHMECREDHIRRQDAWCQF